MKLPTLSASHSLSSRTTVRTESDGQYLAGVSPQAGASKKARQNKDYKTGRIGKRANAPVKVPSGEEEALLDECFEKITPEGYSTWHEYFVKNPDTSREELIGLCQIWLGRKLY